jgi:hypothetical protein
VTEKIAGEKLSLEAGTVDFYEWSVFAGAVVMYPAGKNTLARSRFTLQQHHRLVLRSDRCKLKSLSVRIAPAKERLVLSRKTLTNQVRPPEGSHFEALSEIHI